MTEAWLQGPVPGISPWLMPAAHALIQSGEDLEQAASGLDQTELWARPGGAAAVGFHLLHIAGSLDRLLAYARGESLTDAQRTALRAEQQPDTTLDTAGLVELAQAAITRALAQLRGTPPEAILEARAVGRAGLPSSVLGLLMHAAEHTQRHTGQIIATAKLVGAGRADGDVRMVPNTSAAALARKLAAELPVTQHLGVRVESWSGEALILAAPLAANVNHQGSAFAGSANALATLAGWGVVWLVLRERGLEADAVIQDSRIEYLRPITSDLRARCQRPATDLLDHLAESVRRHGRGRIGLEATLLGEAGPLARFAGRYVVLRRGGADSRPGPTEPGPP